MDKPVEVRNPSYAGATPGDVVRALMRREPKRKDGKPVNAAQDGSTRLPGPDGKKRR